VASSSHDPNQQKVYQWEDSWPGWNHNHLSLRQCRALVKAVCDSYEVPCPIVTQHSGNTYAWSAPSLNRISMQGGEHMSRGSRNVATVMHEVAHHVAWHLYGERIQDHGPAFLGVFIECLVRAKVAPRIALEATARAANLRWKYPKTTPAPQRGGG
jgi:hypothetical protein